MEELDAIRAEVNTIIEESPGLDLGPVPSGPRGSRLEHVWVDDDELPPAALGQPRPPEFAPEHDEEYLRRLEVNPWWGLS